MEDDDRMMPMMTCEPLADPTLPGGRPSHAGWAVYVDAGVLVMPAPGDRPGRLLPDATAALEHLRDAAHNVVLVGAAGAVGAVLAALRDGAPEARVGLPPDASGWLVTGDPAFCAAAREAHRIRTLLVGPAAPGRGPAHRPADIVARDLLDAVLAILASEAMPDARRHGG